MNTLYVMMRVDGLRLDAPQQVIGPPHELENLPWFDGTRDRNTNQAYLGSAINAEPFEPHSHWLEPGVHLHWALPPGLIRGGMERSPERNVHVGDLWMPAAPNRWLVLLRDEALQEPIRRAWLVESDHVHPGTRRPDLATIAYPRMHRAEDEPPYLFLGRQIPLDPTTLLPRDKAPRVHRPLTDYGPALTALGSGEPLFAAHYPSCRSVFGLHDAEAEAGESLTYDVYGWYGPGVSDPFAAFMEQFNADDGIARQTLLKAAEQASDALFDGDLTEDMLSGAPLSEAQGATALRLALADRFSWNLEPGDADAPVRLLCHGRVQVHPQPAALETVEPPQPTAIGSSPAEAYAAYLAKGRALEQADEDRLVQVLAGTDLSAHPLDLSEKLAEARHNEQFRSLPGHNLWAISTPEDSAPKAKPAHPLPDHLAHLLNQLNAAQRAYDEAQHAIDALRQSLFSDWSHYVNALYPEDETQPFADDIDALREEIDRGRLQPLEALQNRAGLLLEGSTDDLQQIPLHSGLLAELTPQVGPEGRAGDTAAPEIRTVPPFMPLLGFDIHFGTFLMDVRPVSPAGAFPSRSSGGKRIQMRFLPGETLVSFSFRTIAEGPSQGKVTHLRFYTSFGRVIGPYARGIGDRGEVNVLRVPHGHRCVGLSLRRHGSVEGMALCTVPDVTHAFPDTGTLAAEVTELARDLRRELAATAEPSHAPLSLVRMPGPQFYQPNDPVVALRDPAVQSTPRNAPISATSEGRHDVLILENVRWAGENTLVQPTNLQDLWPHADGHLFQLQISGPSDWHPVQVAWQAEMLPLAEGSNHDGKRYAPDFITANHALPDGKVDFEQLPRRRRAQTYQYLSGKAILNPAAGDRLARVVADNREIIEGILPGNAADTPPLILPLGGLHSQLLMQRPEFQLGIEDPAALPAGRDFADRIRVAMGGFHPHSPRPDAPFHPIRSGEIELQRLRVIDHFGRNHDWSPRSLHRCRRMMPSTPNARRARLPLRFSAPMRLDFRWLSAAHQDEESGLHPAATPVAGWMTANELDGEIDIYATEGAFLGSVTEAGAWAPAPGPGRPPRSWREIDDPALARVVRWLTEAPDPGLVSAMIAMLESALARIDPEETAAHQARALLLTRPVALVRARLGLTARDGPAEDRSMQAFRRRLTGNPPDTHGWEDVAVPIRLGEHGHLGDGLCAYWIEDPLSRLSTHLFAPHGADLPQRHKRLTGLSGGEDLDEVPLRVSVAGRPLTVAMLMDPRAAVHATTGLLPVKSVQIPPEHYRAQLSRLRVTFRTGPVLSPAGGLELPLPAEQGFAWSWLERSGQDWHEVPHHPTISRAAFHRTFGARADALWDKLHALGQLVPGDAPETATLHPPAEAAPPDRFDVFGLTVEAVEASLHGIAAGIGDIVHTARFDARAEAREGWLQLRPVPAKPKRPGETI